MKIFSVLVFKKIKMFFKEERRRVKDLRNFLLGVCLDHGCEQQDHLGDVGSVLPGRLRAKVFLIELKDQVVVLDDHLGVFSAHLLHKREDMRLVLPQVLVQIL